MGCNLAMADMSCQIYVTCRNTVSVLRAPKRGQIELTLIQVFFSCGWVPNDTVWLLTALQGKKVPLPTRLVDE